MRSGNGRGYYPALSDDLKGKDRQNLRALWDRVTYLLDRVGVDNEPSPTQTVSVAPLTTQIQNLQAAIQTVQDRLTTGTTFIGFGQTQPTSSSVTSIDGSAAGYTFSPSGFGLAMTLASAVTVRSGIGAAASGGNSDITSLTGLTGALQAAAGNALNYGRASVSMAADADQTLGGSEYNKLIVSIAGGTTLTLTRSIIFPTLDGRVWIVYNGTTGGQSLLLKTSGGTGPTVANGTRTLVYCDGTDIQKVG